MRKESQNTNPVVASIQADLDAEVVMANKRLAYDKITDTTKDKARMRGYVDGLMRAQLIVSKYEEYRS